MVMDLVGEDSASPTYWTATNIAELDHWILDAIEELSLVLGCSTEEVRIPLQANRRYYVLDAGKASQLFYIKQMRIEPEGKRVNLKDPEALSRDDYNWMTRTGTPQVWFPIGLKTIRIVPYPTTDGQLLEATAVVVPAQVSGASEALRLEDRLISAVVSYAAAQVLIQQRRLDKVAGWMKEYHNVLGVNMSYSLNLTPKTIELKGIGSAGVRVPE